MSGPERNPALVRVMGAAAIFAVSAIFLTVFDWGSPPSASGHAMRAVPLSRAGH